MSAFSRFNIVSLIIGFAFLYIPIVVLIVFSFNESRLMAVWGGFSTKWYAELLRNDLLLDSAWISLKVAFASATVATVLGVLFAIALTRMGRFPGYAIFSALVFIPIVMPEVISGISLLLLFVTLDMDRGFLTITLAHITFTSVFVAVTVQARLKSFDLSMEEAARDLGCNPFKAFMLVTLPIIAPAVISGWLLAFVLSLDDLVISTFTTGPGATTFPIRIFSSMRLGVKPDINAACTVLIGVVALAVVTAFILTNLSRKRLEGARS
jgi:putrescine transport system permease protein